MLRDLRQKSLNTYKDDAKRFNYNRSLGVTYKRQFSKYDPEGLNIPNFYKTVIDTGKWNPTDVITNYTGGP